MKEKARTNYLLEFGVPGAQKTGGHRDPPLQDFIQVDVGRTRLFFAVSKSRDSLCAQSRFRDKKEKARTDCLLEFGVPGGTGEPPGEGSPRQNSPPDCFASPPALL